MKKMVITATIPEEAIDGLSGEIEKLIKDKNGKAVEIKITNEVQGSGLTLRGAL